MITKQSNGSPLTAGFLSTVAGDGRTFKVRLYVNNVLATWDIGQVAFHRGACGEKPVGGTIYVPYMEAEARGISGSIEGEEIRAEIGLLIDRATDAWEYVKAGTYIVSKPETAGNVTTFRAVGTLGTLGSIAPILTGTTYASIIADAEAATGATVVTQGVTITGSPTDTPTGATWRDVLSEVAEAFGAFLTEDVDGNWVIAAYCSGSDVSVSPDRSQEIPQYGEQPYTLNGVTVESSDVDMSMGNPLIDPWDYLAVEDMGGTVHNVPCLQITHTLMGGCSTNVYAVVESAIEEEAAIGGVMQRQVTEAIETANTAYETAQNVEQHFWFTSTGSDTGAHISQKTQAEFVEDPQDGGPNLLLTSEGVEIREGLDELAKFSVEHGMADDFTVLSLAEEASYGYAKIYGKNSPSAGGQVHIVTEQDYQGISPKYAKTEINCDQGSIRIGAIDHEQIDPGDKNRAEILVSSGGEIKFKSDYGFVFSSAGHSAALEITHPTDPSDNDVIRIDGQPLAAWPVEVVNTSDNNKWNYRKWSDGTLECWARFYISSMNIDQTFGSLKYRAVTISDPNYPVPFTKYPIVTITGQVSNGNGWVEGNNTNYSATAVGGLFAYSPSTQTGVGVTVNIEAKGRWK